MGLMGLALDPLDPLDLPAYRSRWSKRSAAAVAVLPLYVWLIYWLVQDMQTCAACEYNPLSHTPFSRDSPYPPDLVEQVCVYIHIQCIVRKYNK